MDNEDLEQRNQRMARAFDQYNRARISGGAAEGYWTLEGANNPAADTQLDMSNDWKHSGGDGSMFQSAGKQQPAGGPIKSSDVVQQQTSSRWDGMFS